MSTMSAAILVVGGPRDDVAAGRKAGLRNAGNAQRQIDDRRKVKEGRAALLEAERRRIHVAVGNGGNLIDFRLFQRRGTCRAERDDKLRQVVGSIEPAKRLRHRDRCLDRTDAGHQRFEAGAQEGTVFGFRRHDEEDRLAGDRLQFEFHPVIPSLPRTTIIVPVMDAISFAGPSPIA